MMKVGSRVRIIGGPTDLKGKTGTVGEIRYGLYKGAPRYYVVEIDETSQSIQLTGKQVRQMKKEKAAGMLEQVISEMSYDRRHPMRERTEYDSSKEYYDTFEEWLKASRGCKCTVKHDPARGIFIAVSPEGKKIGSWRKSDETGYLKTMTEDHSQYRQHYGDANRPSQTRRDAELDRAPRRDTPWSEDPIAAASDRIYSMFADRKKSRVEEDGEPAAVSHHIVGVMIVDKDSSAVSQRGEEGSIQKKIKVGGTTEQEALARARAFYEKKGYKVLDAWYIKPLADEPQSDLPSNPNAISNPPPQNDDGNPLYK
jgi:hypothetical protein